VVPASGETDVVAGVCAATLVATHAAKAANIVVIDFTKFSLCPRITLPVPGHSPRLRLPCSPAFETTRHFL
jgi:hypothetical protein